MIRADQNSPFVVEYVDNAYNGLRKTVLTIAGNTADAGATPVITVGAVGVAMNLVGTVTLNGATIETGAGSPLTTKGDLYTYSTADARLAVGSNGQILVADSAAATGNKWASGFGLAALGGVISLLGPTGGIEVNHSGTGEINITNDFGVIKLGAGEADATPVVLTLDGTAGTAVLTAAGAVTLTVTGDINLTSSDDINLTPAAAGDLKLGAAATNLIALYGEAGVVQHATTGQVAGFTAGVGAAVLDDSTFTGGVGDRAYTIGDIVRALKNIGIMDKSV